MILTLICGALFCVGVMLLVFAAIDHAKRSTVIPLRPKPASNTDRRNAAQHFLDTMPSIEEVEVRGERRDDGTYDVTLTVTSKRVPM